MRVKGVKPDERTIERDDIKFIDDTQSPLLNMNQDKNETVKHVIKLEQIADLSSIMKERNDVDDTAEDLRSMVDQQLVGKNFDTNNTNGTNLGTNKYNSNSFMRSEVKHEDNTNPQQPASIPNNEQHGMPTIAKK